MVENIPEGEQLIKYHDVKDSPFTIVEDTANKKFFPVLGNSRLTVEDFTSQKDAVNEVTKLTWDNIIKTMLVLIQNTGNMKNYNTGTDEN